MSDENKIFIKLDLDSSSVDKSIDEINKKTAEGVKAESFDTLQESIENLNYSISKLNQNMASTMASSADMSTAMDEATSSVEKQNSAIASMAGVVTGTTGAVIGFSNGVSSLYDMVNSLPASISRFTEKLLFLINLFKDLIVFTNLDKYPFLKEMPKQLEFLSNKLTENRQKIDEMVASYAALAKIKMFVADVKQAAFGIVEFTGSILKGIPVVYSLAVALKAIQFGSIAEGFKSVNFAISAFFSGVKGFGSSVVGFFNGIKNSFGLIASALVQDFNTVTGVFKGSTNSLYGLADAALAVSSKLILLAAGFNLIEGPMDTFLGTTLAVSAALTALATFAIVHLIFAVSDLAKNVGGYLADQFHKAYQSFLQFRKETLIFTQTISAYNREAAGAVGSTEEWNEQIVKLSKTFNFTQGELRKSTAELVAVGYRLGLTKDQTQELLTVVTEYARISGKDLFDSSVAFAQALQGQSQAVLSYGVKLSESSNAQYALKKGMDETFSSMSDHEKIQVRFNNLLGQYNTVAGIGVAIADDWFQNTEKLSVSMDNFNNQVGIGAAYVEDLNLGAAALNKTLSIIPDSLARVVGLFGAFGSRMLQAAGYLIEISFKVFLVYKSFILLDAILKTNTFNVFVTRTLPLLNVSLLQLVKNLGSTTASFNGLKASVSTIGEVLKSNKQNIMNFIFGLNAAGGQSVGLFGLIAQRVSVAFSVIVSASRALLVAMAPIVIKIGLIAAAAYALYKAFIFIEEKTQVFTLMGQVIKELFDSIFAGFGGISTAFDMFLEKAKEIFGYAFGILIAGIAGHIRNFLALIINVMDIFGKKVPEKLKLAKDNVEALGKSLMLANYNAFALKETMLASKDLPKYEFKDLEKLNELLKTLKDETTTDFQKIQEEQNQRIKMIDDALRGEVLSIQKAEDAKFLIRQSAQKKTLDALKSDLGMTEKQTDAILVSSFNTRQKLLNDAFKRGLITQVSYNELRVKNQEKLNDDMEKMAQNSKDAQISIVEQVAKAYELSMEQAQRAVDMTTAYLDAKTKIITGIFETMGRNVVEGAGAWSDFKYMVLGILGDFLIQVGVATMGIGAAVDALAAALTNLSGGGAIAAGALLIFIGGALKALAKQKPSTTGAVGTAGGRIGPSNGSNISVSPRADAERDQINPNVVINIEGSLFSTEQTSRTIVDMISKEFDKSGAQIRTRSFT